MFPQDLLANALKHAQDALGNTKSTIEDKFSMKKLYHFTHNFKSEKKTSIDIVFNNATLSCVFNEEGICYKVLLFLDNMTHLDKCIEYCNENFDAFTENIWIGAKNYIGLHSQDNDNYFIFTDKQLAH